MSLSVYVNPHSIPLERTFGQDLSVETAHSMNRTSRQDLSIDTASIPCRGYGQDLSIDTPSNL